MKTLLTALLTTLVLSTGVGAANAQTPKTCADWRCEFQSRLDADCPCSGQPNHGQYVRCVASVVNDLVKEGLPTNCKGQLKKCAAKSVCGKEAQGFATCTSFQYGNCVDTGSGVLGCDFDPTKTCTTDADCLISSQCKFTRDAAACEAGGGFVNLSPTCCSTCAAPATP